MSEEKQRVEVANSGKQNFWGFMTALVFWASVVTLTLTGHCVC